MEGAIQRGTDDQGLEACACLSPLFTSCLCGFPVAGLPGADVIPLGQWLPLMNIRQLSSNLLVIVFRIVGGVVGGFCPSLGHLYLCPFAHETLSPPLPNHFLINPGSGCQTLWMWPAYLWPVQETFGCWNQHHEPWFTPLKPSFAGLT
jgi:hypothetical protein